MPIKIACFGILVADCVTVTVDDLPERGTLGLVDRIELHIGGCAANTAVSLAKLGASVGVFGGTGTDGFGEFVVRTMETSGVDINGVHRFAEIQTGATVVCVHSDAERSFLHVPGANARFVARDMDWDRCADATLFHVAGPQLMPALERENGIATVLAEAKRRGMITTLDTVMNPASLGWSAVVDALPYLDWALPSESEAALLTGESDPLRQARVFQAGGAKNVAIKRGAQGCLVVPEGSEPFAVPALSVAAVDSLGAGDAWVAGFLLGLVEGWEIDRTARFANAVGACAVQAYGATTGIRGKVETLQLLS